MIELATLLRFIPYLLVFVIAYKKGYPRLAILIVVLVGISLFTLNFNPSKELRGILGSVFSFFLLLHALDLKPRKDAK